MPCGTNVPDGGAVVSLTHLIFGENEDHFTEHLASEAEADREYATNFGMDHPERAWILSSRDVWYSNPYYVGPAVPHPDSVD